MFVIICQNIDKRNTNAKNRGKGKTKHRQKMKQYDKQNEIKQKTKHKMITPLLGLTYPYEGQTCIASNCKFPQTPTITKIYMPTMKFL